MILEILISLNMKNHGLKIYQLVMKKKEAKGETVIRNELLIHSFNIRDNIKKIINYINKNGIF